MIRSRRSNIPIDIEIFYTGEELCGFLRENPIELLFLDIELEGMNGVEAGKFLRQELKNDLTQIVYISSKESYATFQNKANGGLASFRNKAS